MRMRYDVMAVAKQREAKPRHGVPVSQYLESAHSGRRPVVELGRRQDGARGHTGGACHPAGGDDVIGEGGEGIDYHPMSGVSSRHRTHGLASGWRPHCGGLGDVGLGVHTDGTRRERWTP